MSEIEPRVRNVIAIHLDVESDRLRPEARLGEDLCVDSLAATEASITDGWLHSGDYARVDDEGYVFILDRKKDMIMRGGNKVYSVELEYLLVSHPDIAEAAVFGVPDRLAFESVATYVVPATGHSVDVSTVQHWVARHMADFAVPRHVRIVDVIPRNRTGKIDKLALRETMELELHR